MNVELLRYTPEPDKIAAFSALTCYRESLPLEDELSEEMIEEILDKIKESGHHSVIEHASFTFAVEGVSRSLTHQLVRHRLASYSQQSQRYVDIESFDPIIPDSINTDEEARKIYDEFVGEVKKVYSKLKDHVPLEDARYVLPNATKSNIIITMNARELWHFFSLRCCKRAQWEIRDLAHRMLDLCKEVAPLIFENAGAPCLRGPCPEAPEFFCGDPYEKD